MKVFILLCFCWIQVTSSWQEAATVEPSNEVALGEPERQFGQEPKLYGKVQTSYSEAAANDEASKELQLGGQWRTTGDGNGSIMKKDKTDQNTKKVDDNQVDKNNQDDKKKSDDLTDTSDVKIKDHPKKKIKVSSSPEEPWKPNKAYLLLLLLPAVKIIYDYTKKSTVDIEFDVEASLLK